MAKPWINNDQLIQILEQRKMGLCSICGFKYDQQQMNLDTTENYYCNRCLKERMNR